MNTLINCIIFINIMLKNDLIKICNLDFLMIDLLFYVILFKNYTKFARIKILL